MTELESKLLNILKKLEKERQAQSAFISSQQGQIDALSRSNSTLLQSVEALSGRVITLSKQVESLSGLLNGSKRRPQR